MMSHSPSTICLVESKQTPSPGFTVECYRDRLAMVLELLSRGGIGDGCGGSDAHLSALDSIQTRVCEVRESILTEREDPDPYDLD